MNCLQFSENVRDGAAFSHILLLNKTYKPEEWDMLYLTKHMCSKKMKNAISMLNFSKKLKFGSKSLTSCKVYWTVKKLLDRKLRDLYWKKRTTSKLSQKINMNWKIIEYNTIPFLFSFDVDIDKCPIIALVQLITNYTN